LIKKICEVAGEPTLIDDARAEFAHIGLLDAIQRHDNSALFEWLIRAASFQGVSDAVAASFMEKHGCISAADVNQGLLNAPCPKLLGYWTFNGCGYRKMAGRCSEPKYFSACRLPTHLVRNGSLSQAAYSLYLFFRDVTAGDFVSWLDTRLEQADRPKARDRVQVLGSAVLAPMRHIHGVSDKVLNMSLASLLLAGDPNRERWVAAGSGMIAVDTLVHNWLHRSGILRKLKAQHPYGPQCYGTKGCAAILDHVAYRTDVRKFNPDFPKTFPRFVQKAVWRYCAQSELDICNGNRIDDTKRCTQTDCHLYRSCSRVALTPPKS
jgi:hypothetical protein